MRLLQVAACETAIKTAVAVLKRSVNSATATSPAALDPITFRLQAQDVSLPSLCVNVRSADGKGEAALDPITFRLQAQDVSFPRLCVSVPPAD